MSGTGPETDMVETASPNVEPVRETALLVGAAADRILRKPGFAGNVIAAGSKAAFVISEKNLILAFSRADQQPHPRAVLSNLDLRRLAVGMPVRVQGEDVLFGGGEVLSLGDTPPWQRLPVGPGNWVSLENARRGFDRILDAALAMQRGDNLGLALPDIAAGSTAIELDRELGCPTTPGSPLIAAAIEHIRRIVPVCRSGRFDLAMTAAEALIGLGLGLTPSGDDFVGGLLFAAHHLKEAFPGELHLNTEGDTEGDGDAVGAMIARSSSMTNRISHALLGDFALGQGYETMHDLMDGILTADANFDAATHVMQVTSIGNSSGWDMLTGLLTGMLIATGES